MTTNAGSPGDLAVRTIFVVDDEPALRMITGRMLQSIGFQVLTAESGAEAVAKLGSRTDPVDLLLLDLHLVDSEGTELAASLRRICPEARVLFMTGSVASDDDRLALVGPDALLLAKPFNMAELGAAVALALS